MHLYVYKFYGKKSGMANLLLRGTFRQIATSHDNNVPALNTSREQFVWVNKKKYGLRRLYHPRNVQTTQQQQQKRIAQVNVFFFCVVFFSFPFQHVSIRIRSK